MGSAPKAHSLIGSLMSLLGQGRPFVLRLTLFAIAVFGLFQFISASGFGTLNDGQLTSVSVQISSFFSWFLSPASRTLSEAERLAFYQVTSGRVLVTGGGGNIGKHIVRHFLAAGTPVTILDTVFYEDELELSTLPPSAPSLLQVHVGDIRNVTALSSVFAADISGVVHLAAISQPEWCIGNEMDCLDVNKRGTQMVLDALARLNSRDQGKRWFILASSPDIKRNESGHESAEATLATAYGATKVAAEKLVEKYLMGLGASSGRLHAAALRLSNVYGGAYDHPERLVPSIATQALSHLVIQVPGGDQLFDLLHIDDCVDAFLLTIEYLTKSVNSNSFFAPRTSFQAFDIASGNLTSVKSLVNSLVAFTSSKSPIRHVPQVSRIAHPYLASTEKAWRVLRFRASIGTDAGLLRLVKAYLHRTETFLRQRIETTCGKASPSITINNLEKLDDCSIHMQVYVQGEFQAFMTPGNGEEFWTTSSTVQTSEAMIYKQGRERQVYSIRAMNDNWWLGVTHANPGSVQLPRITSHNISSNDPKPVVEWELELKPDDYTAVRLVIPGTDLYLMSPTIVGGNFTIVSKKKKDEWPFRITPICCDAPAPWPFFRDDPLDYTIEYQRTSLKRPFLGSPSKALCGRLERALNKVKEELSTASIAKLMASRREMSRLPTDWINANTLACSNLCEHPTICVDTGDCQCVLSTCVPRQRHLASSSLDSGALSFPPPEFENLTLVEMVERSSWRNVLRPQALSFVSANVSFPRVHVSSVPESDDKWNREHGIYKFESQHCFTADAQLERAARFMSVQPSEAEMTFVPFYQARRDGHENYNHAMETVEGFDATKVIMPVTHDWGGCMHFEWGVWQQREAVGSKVHFHIRSATVWSVMGDLNSPCYRPYQDVVIPPRSGQSPELFKGLQTVANVRPARDRRVLVTFSGSYWGTGKLNRMRIECSRAGWRDGETERRLHPGGPKLKAIFGGTGGYNYIGLLNDTIFCPQPGGIVGWTWRIVESVYAGCIPLLIGPVSQFPFFDMIDWSKISVQIDTSELDQLEDILLSRYTLKDIERLQTNLMLVRNAFVYPLDEASKSQVKEMMIDDRGPLWFALHSTKMRMLTMWPTAFGF